jgi:circadian clock protein KaiC
MIERSDTTAIVDASTRVPERDALARVPLGIPGLDAVLQGGLPAGNTLLAQGEPGTGKTVLAMHFLHAGIQQYRQPGLLILFEEHPSRIYRDARAFGWDFRGQEEAGMLRVILTSPEVFSKELEHGYYAELVLRQGFRRVAIDAISHVEWLGMDACALRREMSKLVNALQRHGLTTLLTRECQMRYDPAIHPAEYICDTVLALSRRSDERGSIHELEVRKHRGSPYLGGMHRFYIKDGIVIE